MSKFKEGDVVYSLLRGQGKVLEVGNGKYTAVSVQFDHSQSWFMADGKLNEYDHRPEIYHTQPQITIPKRKVKKEVKRWVMKGFNPADMGYKNISPEEAHKYKQITHTWEDEED